MTNGKVRIRVTELIHVPASELRPSKKNPRRHTDRQRQAFQALMEDVGFAGAVIAYRKRGKLEIIDGHLRAEELGDTPIPVLVTDLTEREARELMLLGDRVGEMAELEPVALEELVGSVELEAATLQELTQSMVDDSLRGERRPGHASNTPKTHGVIVECKGEDDATVLFERLKGEGYTCRTVARAQL